MEGGEEEKKEEKEEKDKKDKNMYEFWTKQGVLTPMQYPEQGDSCCVFSTTGTF